jgi:hypothetical protein
VKIKVAIFDGHVAGIAVLDLDVGWFAFIKLSESPAAGRRVLFSVCSARAKISENRAEPSYWSFLSACSPLLVRVENVIF